MKNYYIVLGLYYLLVCIIFFVLKRIIKEKNSFLNYWSIGYLFAGIGILYYTLFNNHTKDIDLLLFSLAYNFFPLVGISLIFHGYNLYDGKKSNFTLFYILSIVLLVNNFVFSLYIPDNQAKMAINGAILAFLYFYIAYKIRNKTVSKFYNNRYNYLVFAFIHLTRIYHAIFINKDNFMPNTFIANLFVILACLLAMITIFNMILVLMTDINQALKDELNTKNQLYRVISHDVKGQLNNLLNYHLIFKKSYNEWDAQKINNWITDIENIAVSSYTLMENMLLWSSNNQEKFTLNIQKHNFIALVNESIDFFNSQLKFKNQTIDFNNTQNIFVDCDKDILDAIMRNLIINAIKNSDSNETIQIAVKELDEKVYFSIKNKVHYQFEERSKIINATINLKTNIGTGYGLEICKNFIAKHLGELKCEFTNNQSIEMEFFIPKQITINEK